MFLQGEVNWVLVLGVVATVAALLAVLGLFSAARLGFAYRNATAQLERVSMSHEGADRRLREVLDAIPVALVETDLGGKFIFANRAAHQLLGRRDAELLGLRFHSATWGITYPDGRTIPPDLLPSARALRGQTVKGFQHLLANPSTRRKMLVSVTAMPILNAVGEVIGSTAAIVEIETLSQPEPQPAPDAMPGPAPVDDVTRRVFDAASSALVVVDAQGRVREANRSALELHGLDGDAVQAVDFADLFLALDERAEGRQALRAARLAQPDEAESIEARASGLRWRPLPLQGEDGALLLAGERGPPTASSAPIALEQEPHEMAAAQASAEPGQIDVLQALVRAQAEELAAARRLESVGRLTGGVAHDFSALLGVMTNALDMMLKQADQPDRVRRLGGAALAAGRRGEALTRRLSAFSQGEDAVADRLDLGVLLRGQESALRALAGPDIDLLVETPAEPVQAVIDPAAFQGAIRALVENAVLSASGRGSVAVRLEALQDQAQLSVRDDGPGMDADTLARASEPFFTTREGAAGLGLSQAYAFTRQSGGALSLHSQLGQGAEIVLKLPLAGDDMPLPAP